MEEKNIENLGTLYSELVAAQSEFGPIVKNKVLSTPKFKTKYADLQAIIDVVRPVLNRHGFFLSQRVTSEANGVRVETILFHSSGASLSSGPLFMPASRPDAQGFGSARTYACRYSLSSFLGIASEDDDDGASASGLAAFECQQSYVPTARSTFKLTDAMISAARVEAEKGLAAYQKYFEGQSKDWKTAMRDSGNHDEFKTLASKKDVAK